MNKILLFFLIIPIYTSYSQNTALDSLFTKYKKKDLKIGLVLSGGGAKGLAHIGVIKVLEEAGVRIDYIGGTSAGAMVGALYASGYNAKELDSILRSYNFLKLIQNPSSRELYSFFQKENSEKYALSLPIKNGMIGLPVALSRGQNMLNELSFLTRHVHHITNFKKLPIPFYCIATNIETGSQVVLEKGFLPQAIRASGAFPSVFEPVRIDNQYLVDGGIVNNFPVDIMYNKNIDVIIGVDVQGNLEKKENLDSALKVVMQIVSFQMYNDKEYKENKTDIYIKPNLKNNTVSSFDNISEIIKSGEVAARKEMDFLVSIAAQQEKKPLKIRKKLSQYRDKYLKIKKVIINGNINYTRNYILSILHLNRHKTDSITYQEFNENVNRLAATQNFKSIDYIIRPYNDSSIVEFNLSENEVSNFFQIGVHFDNLYKTGVLLNYTGKNFLTKNDIVSTDIVLGDNLRYNLSYLVDNGFHWRFGISHRYNSFKNNQYFEPNSDTPISFTNSVPLRYNDFTTQLYFQTKFNEKMAINGGVEHKYLNIFTEILNNNQNNNFHFDKSSYYSIFSEIILDTRNSKNFTKKGWYFKAKYNTYFKASDFNQDFEPFSQIQIKLENATTYFDKFTTQFNLEAGLTIGSVVPSFKYALGGHNENFINNFVPFYGYDVADISDAAFVKSGVNFQYEFYDKNYITTSLNIAGVNNEFIFDGTVLDNLKTGYAIGYGIKSIIGPIEIRYAATPDNKNQYWYFNIGYWF